MPDYEQTGTIHAEPDVLFDYLAEVENIPEYLGVLTDAEPTGLDDERVEADIHGEIQQADGWLRVDCLERRMEWGTRDGPYHGWLQVEPDDVGGSVVTIHLFQDHISDADEDIAEALENIQRLADSGIL